MGRHEKLIHPDGTPFSEEERKERARKYQRAYYHSHKKLKGRNQKKATIFPKKEVVKESCNRILKGAGFKNSEQVKDAIEYVMDRERLKRQKIKLKKIRRMIWGR